MLPNINVPEFKRTRSKDSRCFELISNQKILHKLIENEFPFNAQHDIINLQEYNSTVDTTLEKENTIISDITCQIPSQSSSSSSLYMPNVIYYKHLKYYPCVKFDNYLLLLDDNKTSSIYEHDKKLHKTSIPKFIGYTFIVLRNKFEEELENNKFFIDHIKFPDNKKIVRISKLIYNYADCLKTVENITEKLDALSIFCVILEILQLFEYRLIQFSKETAEFINNNTIKQPCKPNCEFIKNQITKKCKEILTKTKSFNKKRWLSEKKDKNIDNIGKIIEDYYLFNEIKHNQYLELCNKFQLLIYRDFRCTKTTMQRYLMKFVLRHCLYFVRRYVITKCNTNDINNQNNQFEYVHTFATIRMAQYLAGTIAEIKDPHDSYKLKIKILSTLFTLNQDNLFSRQKHIHDVIIKKKNYFCHTDCKCKYNKKY